MKKLPILIYFLVVLSAKADYWTQKANFPGVGRQLPSSFVIGNNGYVSCGLGGSGFYNDLWEYNLILNQWTQKSNLPAAVRWGAVGFSINNKGYISTGRSNIGWFNDLWEYDPITNVWTQKANFGGVGRYWATGFSIGSKAYLGCGSGSTGLPLSDFWEWDQATNVWTQKNSFPLARVSAKGFSINNNGYITTGATAGINYNDIWEYDVLSNLWIQKANLPDSGRYDASAFVICGKGYLGTGEMGPFYPLMNDFWQFDPLLNQWIQKANFGGGNRDDCASFAISNKGYITLGQDSSSFPTDLWEYTPDSACATGIEKITTDNLDFTVSPNPAKDFLIINYDGKEKLNLTITDVDGKKVFEIQLLRTQSTISLKDFAKGIYFVEASNEKQEGVKKFVKE